MSALIQRRDLPLTGPLPYRLPSSNLKGRHKLDGDYKSDIVNGVDDKIFLSGGLIFSPSCAKSCPTGGVPHLSQQQVGVSQNQHKDRKVERGSSGWTQQKVRKGRVVTQRQEPLQPNCILFKKMSDSENMLETPHSL